MRACRARPVLRPRGLTQPLEPPITQPSNTLHLVESCTSTALHRMGGMMGHNTRGHFTWRVRVLGASLVPGTLRSCAWGPWMSHLATALMPIVQCACARQLPKVWMCGYLC